MTAEQVRDLLRQHGTTRSQSAADWQGEIPLPLSVEEWSTRGQKEIAG
jgi:hypothetical protein